MSAGARSAEDGAREVARVHLLGGVSADGRSAGCHCVRKHGVGELSSHMVEKSKIFEKGVAALPAQGLFSP